MVNEIYGVALNGAFDRVSTYRVLRETPKTYIVDKVTGGHIRKDSMCDRWESYYTDKSEAESALSSLLEHHSKMCRKPDIGYIHRRLVRIRSGVNTARYIDDLIRYVEGFLSS